MLGFDKREELPDPGEGKRVQLKQCFGRWEESLTKIQNEGTYSILSFSSKLIGKEKWIT